MIEIQWIPGYNISCCMIRLLRQQEIPKDPVSRGGTVKKLILDVSWTGPENSE